MWESLYWVRVLEDIRGWENCFTDLSSHQGNKGKVGWCNENLWFYKVNCWWFVILSLGKRYNYPDYYHLG